MAVTQSGYGRVSLFEDFCTFYGINTSTTITTYVPGTGAHNLGLATFFSDDEGTVGYTTDEANGVVALTSDVGDDDSVWLRFESVVQPPVNGPAVTESRYKFNSATLSCVWHGFTETMALDTPVVPFEFATATTTFNGTGQMVGISLDPDATTDDFRANSGNDAAVAGTDRGTGAALGNAGIRANETITADEWYISRVEIDASGRSEIWMGHKGRGLDLILSLSGLATVNALFATVGLENRSAAARIFEVDYFGLEYARDWEVT